MRAQPDSGTVDKNPSESRRFRLAAIGRVEARRAPLDGQIKVV